MVAAPSTVHTNAARACVLVRLLLGRSLFLLLLALATGMQPAAAEARNSPNRIVSMNPCIDAILMEVARPQQIAAISHYSQDASATSINLVLAKRFRTTAGTAEEVIALNPDLVIAGAHVALPTVHALQRMGIALLQTRVADSVQQSRAQIMQVADAVGAPARGRQLLARIDAALARATPAPTSTPKATPRLQPTPARAEPISAVIWQGEGMVPGAGTLADELLRRTGFRNMSSEYGLQQWDLLPLEQLLAHPPQVLLTVHTS